MKKILKKINTWESALHCYDEDGNIIDVSNLRGDVSNLSGDVSNLSGDVDDCEITAEERTAGVDVSDLVG